jgi:hypothetical protein
MEERKGSGKMDNLHIHIRSTKITGNSLIQIKIGNNQETDKSNKRQSNVSDKPHGQGESQP